MANIKDKIAQIRQAIFGKEVRESIASGIEAINKEVENTTARQDNVEAQFQAVLDETTDKDVISAPEITAARVGADNTTHSNLKARLDAEHNEVMLQLADNEKETFHAKAIFHGRKKPIITFVDDDGRLEVYTILKYVMETKNIPMTSALVTGRIGIHPRHLNLSQVYELKGIGMEFVSHTHDHVKLSELATEEEIRYQFEQSQAWLKEHGLVHDVLVYPFGGHNALVRNIAREYFSAAIDVTQGINYPPMRTYQLYRINIAPDSTFEDLKPYIDECYQKNGWLIFMTHVFDWTDNTLQTVMDTIDYIQNLGIDIVTVKEGLRRRGNILDVGDYISTQDSLKEVAIIDSNGEGHGATLGSSLFLSITDLEDKNEINGDISKFKDRCTTKIAITAAQTSGLGLPSAANGGVLEVVRNGTSFGYQAFYPRLTGLKYTRYWILSENKWSDWVLSNGATVLPHNTRLSDATINDFPEGITLNRVSNQNAQGFPNNLGGLLTTYKVGSDGYSYQVYKTYNSFNMYIRYEVPGGTWSDWKKITLE